MSVVFIGYARVDRELMLALQADLRSEGHIVWWDGELEPGQSFRKVIEQQLRAAKAIIIIWSRASIGSEWVIEEAEHALKRDILISVRAADVNPDDLPAPFKTRHTCLIDDRVAIRRRLRSLGVAPGAEPSVAVTNLPDQTQPRYSSNAVEGRAEVPARQPQGGVQRTHDKMGWTRLATALAGAVAMLAMLAGLARSGNDTASTILHRVLAGERVPPHEDADDSAWRDAETEGLIRSWRKYREKYPEGKHARKAQERIEKRLKEGRLIRTEPHAQAIVAVQISADLRHVIALDLDRKRFVWNTRTWEVVSETFASATKEVAPRPQRGLSPLRGGTIGLRGGYPSTTLVYSLHDQVTKAGRFETFLFSSTIDRFLISRSQSVVMVFLAEPGFAVVSFPGGIVLQHTGAVSDAVVSVDEEFVVAAGTDGAIRIWSLFLQKEREVLKGHVGRVRSIALSDDKAVAVSGGDDKTVRLWDLTELI